MSLNVLSMLPEELTSYFSTGMSDTSFAIKPKYCGRESVLKSRPRLNWKYFGFIISKTGV